MNAHPRRWSLLVVSLLLATSACGGSKSDDETKGNPKGGDTGLTVDAVESGLAEAGKPVRGGSIVYGLEAETDGGYCLADSQLAISGIMVTRAIYDTLTVPSASGGFQPNLARSVEHSDDYRTWTITLRPGITFQDGSPLDADVVKLNLDTYRGKNPKRSSQLFAFVLTNITDVTVSGPLTVTVTTKTPWVAFPSFLYLSGRMGIMAKAQLESDQCAQKPIGTGPFSFVSWTPGQKLVVKRNPDYWQIAPDGKPYPYLDQIEFRPIPDVTVRLQSLESGTIDVMHTAEGSSIAGKLKSLRDAGKANLLVSAERAEVNFLMLNVTKAPFDDIRVRRALAMALDRASMNQRLNGGVPTVADGPFAKGVIGHLDNPGFPTFDLAGAKKLVAEYEADGHEARFVLSNTPDPASVRIMESVKQQAEAAGFQVELKRETQAAQINDAIGRTYQATVFRNYPGDDPDANYVWWYGTLDGGASNLVNFSGFDDADINRLLDLGRTEADPAARKAAYEDINRRFADQAYSTWLWTAPWAIALGADVHGVLGPPLPGDDPSKPGPTSTNDPDLQSNTGLATGHSLLGLWTEAR